MRLYDPELMWAALGRILSVYMLGAAPGGSRARWERRARVLLLEGRWATVKRLSIYITRSSHCACHGAGRMAVCVCTAAAVVVVCCSDFERQ